MYWKVEYSVMSVSELNELDFVLTFRVDGAAFRDHVCVCRKIFLFLERNCFISYIS
jgi:hypothetical protein